MKTIGILGGMGPEASSDLYLRIIRIFQSKGAKYDADFPEIVLLSLPLPDVVENLKDEKKIELMLIDGVKRLENCGVDFIVIPCNTVSKYLIVMQKSVIIPIFDVVSLTKARVNGIKIGLLGTELTITSRLYGEAIVLDQDEQRKTTKVIMNILSGKKLDSDRVIIKDQIRSLRKLGANKVILGCTELPLIINSEVCIDTLQVLAEEAVKESLV